MEIIQQAIERLSTASSQFIIVCVPTTGSDNEKVYIDGKLFDDGKYFLHLLENKYKNLPTIIYYCDYTDSEDFFYSLSGASSLHNYNKENIHLIFDKNVPENHGMPPEILKSQLEIMEHRIRLLQEPDIREKYFKGELVVVG